MRGGAGNRQPVGTSAAGYIDNRSTVWIVLIIGAIAITHYASLKSGKGVIELFWSLPPSWPTFLITLAGVALTGLLGLFVAAALWHGAPFTVVQESGVDLLREREPGQVLGGVYVATVALTLVAFGLVGSGWLWGLIAVLGLLLLSVAGSVLLRRVTWELSTDAISRSERLFGSPRIQAWPVPESPEFVIDEITTGGAFGQPLERRHRVRLGESVLLETGDAERAASLLTHLQTAYPQPEQPG